jgi:hypothetical protein
MVIFLKRALRPLCTFLLISPIFLFAQVNLILVNDDIMPPKEVKKIEEMGVELYEKAHVPIFVAAVKELNTAKPIDLINTIKQSHSTYILLYF